MRSAILYEWSRRQSFSAAINLQGGSFFNMASGANSGDMTQFLPGSPPFLKKQPMAKRIKPWLSSSSSTASNDDGMYKLESNVKTG